MAVSTKSLQLVLNIVASQGIPDPRNLPSGYGDDLALDLGSRVMADLITERFNWKFNRAVAVPIYTNSWQQDYPQPAQPNGIIAWGEDCDICDINNTSYPKPLNWDGPVTWMRGLTRTSVPRWRPTRICWMYNSELTWGTWPGAQVVYHPLLTTGTPGQNSLMNMIDSNGNYLILTGFGTTGLTAPAAPANSTEGTTVNDGSCVWTVVSGTSQGFRVDFLPNSTGPTYQLIPSYQLAPPIFTTYEQLLTPIPDSFSRHFQTGLESYCLMASPNPADRPRGNEAYGRWIKTMTDMIKQGDQEPNTYGLIPQTSVVESRWGWKGPYTADQPI
jgi:hypothetical protein